MTLQRVVVRDVRNLAQVELRPAPRLNLITGANASGKTSLLEALHLLALGRSFRTTQLRAVIRHGANALTVYGELAEPGGGVIALGVEKSPEASRIRIQGATVPGAAALAERLPVILLDPHSHALLEQGPRLRRQLLDWGAFHVEHGFLDTWQRYQRALAQRNVLLRAGRLREASAWEPELAQAGETIAAARARFVEAVAEPVRAGAAELGGLTDLSFAHQRGWPAERPLGEVLAEARAGDREVGHTRHGPHRGDLAIRWRGQAAAQGLSRGQQKLLVAAVRLAQARLLSTLGVARCLVLVDDLAAELDREHRGQLLAALCETEAQLFVTATEQGQLEAIGEGSRRFHVEHGAVTELV